MEQKESRGHHNHIPDPDHIHDQDELLLHPVVETG